MSQVRGRRGKHCEWEPALEKYNIIIAERIIFLLQAERESLNLEKPYQNTHTHTQVVTTGLNSNLGPCQFYQVTE